MSGLVSALDTISNLPPLSADAQRTLAAWRLETAAGLRAVSRAPLALHGSLSDDTFSAIFAFLEAEPGAAYYSFDVDPPPGPLSELFTFFVRIYFKPFDADGDGNRWARWIDLDEPLPPLRPYAISISLRPSHESRYTLTQESCAYFLDNMIFK